MTDFFDRVEQELVAAVERETLTAAPRRRRATRWLASHALVTVGVVVLGGAGATAAVVALQGTPSHPAAGLVPRQPQDHRVRDLHYRVRMSPSLGVGEVGWCSEAKFRYDGQRRWFGGGGCGPAAVTPTHVFGGGTTTISGPGPRLFVHSIVDSTVAYALPTSGKRVLPVDDAGLPNGWRAIVLFPGETHDGRLRYRDAGDRPIRTRPINPAGDFASRQPVTVSTRALPDDVPCAITPPAGSTTVISRWLVQPQPVEGLNGRALLACGQTAFRLKSQWVEVTVLLDAAAPATAAPMPLPSAARPPSARETYEVPAVGPFYFETVPHPGAGQRGPIPSGDVASARRKGRSWVLVRAKTRAMRERVLDEIKTRSGQP